MTAQKFRNQLGNSSLFILLAVVVIAAIIGFVYFNKSKPQTPQTSHGSPKTIGILQDIQSLDTVVEGYKAGMQSLGYTEGKDVIYKYELADNRPDKLTAISKDFVNQNVDLIAAVTEVSLVFAEKETTTSGKLIPIVYGLGDNSIKLGTIKDYKSAGNNVTGVENLNSEAYSKKYDFLRQISPKAKNVGIFFATAKNSTPVTLAALAEARNQATKQGFKVVGYELQTPPSPATTDEMQKVADSIRPGDIDAIISLPDPVANYRENYKILIALGKRLKIPTVLIDVSTISQGGLMAYNANFLGIGNQMAIMTDKIFKGTKPADIPIEFPKKYILVINLKTAQEIGITVPDSILQIADQVIK